MTRIKKTPNKADEKDTKLVQCYFCPYSSRFKMDITTHERVHTGESPFPCDVCHLAYKSKSAWRKHTKTHGKDCTNGKEHTNSNQKQSSEKHTGVEHLQCYYCSETFFDKSNLETHEQTHTGSHTGSKLDHTIIG